jgi:hypothetical protein
VSSVDGAELTSSSGTLTMQVLTLWPTTVVDQRFSHGLRRGKPK